VNHRDAAELPKGWDRPRKGPETPVSEVGVRRRHRWDTESIITHFWMGAVLAALAAVYYVYR
jgi:hypothetical protein